MTEPTADHQPDTSGREPTPTPAVVDGRYQLREVVGGGLTATTWAGRDLILSREVEVKLWRDDSAEALQAHRAEMAEMRKVDPSLSKLLDAGSHEGRPYLVSDPTAGNAEAETRSATALPPEPGPDPEPDPASPDPTPAPPHPTPPSTPAVNGRPRNRSTGNRTTGVIVATVVVAVLLVAAGLLARPPGPDADDGIRPAFVEVAYSPATFDPEGDGDENPRELGALLDGTPSTAWSTDRYSTRKFGNLKSGLGLILQLAVPTTVEEVAVFTTSSGWAAQVHVADAPAADLAGWGPPVTTVGAGSVSEVLDLPGSTVGFVLVWFTDLGEATRLSVSEIVIRASGG